MGDQLAHLCKLVLGNASVEDEARVAMGEAKRVAVFKRKNRFINTVATGKEKGC